MNCVQLLGRLTADPVLYRSVQTDAVKFTLAVDRRKKSDGTTEADFIPMVAFGNVAQFVIERLKKGARIAIAGRVNTGRYVDNSGKTVYTFDIIADSVYFAE